MPDYSMCDRQDCPRRYRCARYMMKPSKAQQDYMSFDPETCESFWDIKDCGYRMRTITEVKKEESCQA